MLGKLIIKSVFMSCIAVYIMLAAYESYGVHPAFTTIMLVLTFWISYYLWRGLSKRGSDLSNDIRGSDRD